jgi:hypothetical protein
VFHGFELLLIQMGSSATICRTTSNVVFLLGRAPSHTASDPAVLLSGFDALTCPATLRGSRTLRIKKCLAETVCSKARVFSRHAHALPRCLKDVRSNSVIMTCKLCDHALQYRATVQHRTTDRSRARLAEAMTQ